MPGKVLYTLNEKEVERFRKFALEAIALETMMDNFLDSFKRQTEEVQKRRDDFFRKIGAKLPPDPENFDMFGNLHNVAVEEKDGATVVVRMT